MHVSLPNPIQGTQIDKNKKLTEQFSTHQTQKKGVKVMSSRDCTTNTAALVQALMGIGIAKVEHEVGFPQVWGNIYKKRQS